MNSLSLALRRNSERTSKGQKGSKSRDGESGGINQIDDPADAGEDVAAVLHAKTSLNERTGEIPSYGQDKNKGEKTDGFHRGEFRQDTPDDRPSAKNGEEEGADDPLPRFLGRDGGAEGS